MTHTGDMTHTRDMTDSVVLYISVMLCIWHESCLIYNIHESLILVSCFVYGKHHAPCQIRYAIYTDMPHIPICHIYRYAIYSDMQYVPIFAEHIHFILDMKKLIEISRQKIGMNSHVIMSTLPPHKQTIRELHSSVRVYVYIYICIYIFLEFFVARAHVQRAR